MTSFRLLSNKCRTLLLPHLSVINLLKNTAKLTVKKNAVRPAKNANNTPLPKTCQTLFVKKL